MKRRLNNLSSPPGFRRDDLRLKEPMHRVRLVDVVVLLSNLFRAAEHPEVGHVDANHVMNEYVRRMGRRFLWLPRSILEGSLAACNFLDEKNAFWEPRGNTFDQFLNKQTPYHLRYDKQYNFFIDTDKIRGSKK